MDLGKVRNAVKMLYFITKVLTLDEISAIISNLNTISPPEDVWKMSGTQDVVIARVRGLRKLRGDHN